MLIPILIGTTSIVAIPTLGWLAWHFYRSRKTDLKSQILQENAKQERERIKKEKQERITKENEEYAKNREKILEEKRKLHPPKIPVVTPKSERDLLMDIRTILIFLVVFVYSTLMLTSCTVLYTLRTNSPAEMLYNDIQRSQRNNR
jgi:hypothetical protein